MRGHLNIAGQAAAANVKLGEVRNYHLLRSVDFDAYAVVVAYRDTRKVDAGKARDIEQANPDLLPYFLYVQQEEKREENAGRVARAADSNADRTTILTHPDQEREEASGLAA